MPELKVGDVVQLNSGGPKMTIIKPSATTVGHWYCSCFKEDRTVLYDAFPPESLTKVK
jgi:uncharacterized protein YodC (DUF2158 family)